MIGKFQSIDFIILSGHYQGLLDFLAYKKVTACFYADALI
jgi:hypothetical protein